MFLLVDCCLLVYFVSIVVMFLFALSSMLMTTAMIMEAEEHTEKSHIEQNCMVSAFGIIPWCCRFCCRFYKESVCGASPCMHHGMEWNFCNMCKKWVKLMSSLARVIATKTTNYSKMLSRRTTKKVESNKLCKKFHENKLLVCTNFLLLPILIIARGDIDVSLKHPILIIIIITLWLIYFLHLKNLL